MVKEFMVKYGKETYKRNALNREAQEKLGSELIPKIAGFGQIINTIVRRQYLENENHYSIYQAIQDIFNPEDLRWLIDAVLYDFENPVCVGNKYLMTEDEVNEHFAGDFIRKVVVALQFAYKNLGEFGDFMKNFSGLETSIVSYLEAITQSYLNNMEQSLNVYTTNEKKEKKTTKKREKKL